MVTVSSSGDEVKPVQHLLEETMGRGAVEGDGSGRLGIPPHLPTEWGTIPAPTSIHFEREIQSTRSKSLFSTPQLLIQNETLDDLFNLQDYKNIRIVNKYTSLQ
jgi:hypothetical protein